MTRLNSYNSYMNYSKMKIIIIGSLLLSNIVAIFLHFIQSFYLNLILSLLHVPSMICTYYIYHTLIRRLRHHAQRSRVKNTTAQTLDISMAKTVKLLVAVMAIVYTPHAITSVVRTYYIYKKRTHPGLYLNLATIWSYMFLLSNSSINSVIYGYTNRRVKAFVIRFCQRNRIQDQDQNS